MLDPRLLKLIENFLKLFFGAGIAIIIGVFIYLGIQYIVSGKTEAIKKVHEKWLYLLIGIILIFLSLTIPRIIGLFFNIDIKILK